MKRILGLAGLAMTLLAGTAQGAEPMLVVHGGAGGMSEETVAPERVTAWKSGINEALDIGYGVLDQGGSALDAVEATIVYLENNPAFNAGKGAVYTSEGKNELDASIMDGSNLQAGAVANVTRVKNPIRLARAVMEKSRHLMFVGHGAETFAEQQGLEFVDPDYFRTDASWARYQRALKREEEADKKGTVGVVALDASGNLAAGTSTGGLMMKRYGRVGDSPIIGAGTYANNASCGVSATGEGEYFIRATIARDICARVEFKGEDVKTAADAVIHQKLEGLGGQGGVIVLDAKGNHAFSYNTRAMIRGVKSKDVKKVAVFEKP